MLVHQIINYYAKSFSDAPMIADNNNHYTFSEGLAAINQMAHFLLEQGLKEGDRLAVIGENAVEHILFLFAAAQTGLVLVPINYRLAIGVCPKPRPARWLMAGYIRAMQAIEMPRVITICVIV